MELSGVVTRRSVGFRLGPVEAFALRGKRSGGLRRRVAFALEPWADEDHRVYYARSIRCGGSTVDAKGREEKKKATLVRYLSRDLAALYSSGFTIRGEERGEEGVTGEVREKMMREAIGLLTAELNHLKEKEKEMKRRKKEEKAAMKAAKLRNCADEDSSSSSSSDSSESECDEVVDTKQTANTTDVPPEVNPASLAVLEQPPELNQELASTQLKADEKGEIILAPSELNHPEVPSSPPEADEKAEAIRTPLKKLDPAAAEAADARGLDKIEVCMGGKCKKSGAAELLQELEKKVGIEGAVVGCRCLGKCKQGGPNVRVVSHHGAQGGPGDGSKRTFCIGVGFEDVGAMVAAALGQEDADVGLLAA